MLAPNAAGMQAASTSTSNAGSGSTKNGALFSKPCKLITVLLILIGGISGAVLGLTLSGGSSTSTHVVTTSFRLTGSPSDYDDVAQTSIKTTLANGASVPVSAVTISLTAGSVIVSAEIAVDSAADAIAKASALASGIMQDASSLESALMAQFNNDGLSTATLSVSDIISAPTAATTSSSEDSASPAAPAPPLNDCIEPNVTEQNSTRRTLSMVLENVPGGRDRRALSTVVRQIYDLPGQESGWDDLGNLTRFVVADLSGWARQNPPMDIILLYRQGQSSDAQSAKNQPFVSSTLPSHLSGFSVPDYSCICGNGDTRWMTVMYDSVDPGHRLSVVVHEYYHVIQLANCGSPPSNPFPMVWLWEGAATLLELLYLRDFFEDAPRPKLTSGNDFNYYDAVTQSIDYMRSEAQGGYTFGPENESYENTCMNYRCSVAAVAYLVSRIGEGGLRTVLLDFFTTTKCQEVYDPAGGLTKEEGFEANFGIPLSSFYADFNAWLTDSSNSAADLLPTRAAVKALFAHCTVCADLCDSGAGNSYNGNGACDGACSPFGSDCTDCGRTPRPTVFPVTLTDHNDIGNRRQMEEMMRSREQDRFGRRYTVSADGSWCM